MPRSTARSRGPSASNSNDAYFAVGMTSLFHVSGRPLAKHSGPSAAEGPQAPQSRGLSDPQLEASADMHQSIDSDLLHVVIMLALVLSVARYIVDGFALELMGRSLSQGGDFKAYYMAS